jgi:hypothetical protein
VHPTPLLLGLARGVSNASKVHQGVAGQGGMQHGQLLYAHMPFSSSAAPHPVHHAIQFIGSPSPRASCHSVHRQPLTSCIMPFSSSAAPHLVHHARVHSYSCRCYVQGRSNVRYMCVLLRAGRCTCVGVHPYWRMREKECERDI